MPPPPAVAAKGYVVVDAFSGRIIAGQNDTERLEPASLTKLMTAYVVFHALKDGKLRLAWPMSAVRVAVPMEQAPQPKGKGKKAEK